jgi:hypothetical protein
MQDLEERLRHLLTHIETLERELNALSDAIWQSIDHDDSALLEAGVKFKQAFNARRHALQAATGELSKLLRDCPLVGSGTEGAEAGRFAVAPEDHDTQAVAGTGEARAAQAQTSEPDFGDKLPFGFVLGDQTYTSSGNWPLFYHALLQELYRRQPEKLAKLPDREGFTNAHGRPLFARNADAFSEPLAVSEHLFAEGDLALPLMIRSIKALFGEVGLPISTLKILLKERHRGTVETYSLAA